MGDAAVPTAPGASGHLPTLVGAFVHFAVSTMLWVLLGALGIYIAEDLGLSAFEKGLVVATPILSGSLLRIPLGLLSDRVGAKRVGVGILLSLLVPLVAGWRGGDSLAELLAVGLLLGIAGASFSVAIPLASRWYPPERQGLVLGLTGAGTCATVLSYLFAPRLAEALGWRAVLGLAVLPALLATMAFVRLARERPRTAAMGSAREYRKALWEGDLWALGLIYAVTFGGYVGLGTFIPVLLRDQYQTPAAAAGAVAAAAALAGGGIRPFGGYLADRIGGGRMLSLLLPAIAIVYLCIARAETFGITVGLVVAAMLCMGIGNGALFQVVPQRFPGQMGIATGVVGALGGLGGFVLPVLLGSIRELSGSFDAGFLLLGLIVAGAMLLNRSPGFRSSRAGQGRSAGPVPVAGSGEASAASTSGGGVRRRSGRRVAATGTS